MTCNLQTLTSQACADGFLNDLTPQQVLAIEMRLLQIIAGDTNTVAQLAAQACASGFFGQTKSASKAIEMQLWCNAGGV